MLTTGPDHEQHAAEARPPPAHAPATADSFPARPGDGATLLRRGLPCAERQHGLPQRQRSGLARKPHESRHNPAADSRGPAQSTAHLVRAAARRRAVRLHGNAPGNRLRAAPRTEDHRHLCRDARAGASVACGRTLRALPDDRRSGQPASAAGQPRYADTFATTFGPSNTRSPTNGDSTRNWPTMRGVNRSHAEWWTASTSTPGATRRRGCFRNASNGCWSTSTATCGCSIEC
jgi:hypothetical protein